MRNNSDEVFKEISQADAGVRECHALSARFSDLAGRLRLPVDKVRAGVRDILAEHAANHIEARAAVRSLMQRQGTLVAVALRGKTADHKNGLYSDYYNFSRPLRRLEAHQVPHPATAPLRHPATALVRSSHLHTATTSWVWRGQRPPP